MNSVYLIYKSLRFDGSTATGNMKAPFTCVGAVVLNPEVSDGACYTLDGKHDNAAEPVVQAALSGNTEEVHELAPVVNPLGGEIWHSLEVAYKYDDVPCSRLAPFVFSKYRGHILDNGDPDSLK